MSVEAPNLTELKAIVDWVNVTDDVRELSLKYGEVELFISKNEHTQYALAAAAPAHAHAHAPEAPTTITPATDPGASAPTIAPVQAVAAGELATGEVAVKAPMVGTFYASPQPGAPAFVHEGDTVQADTVLGIVEVMKLMNNIEAGISGTVVRVLVENEAAVQYGQPLFVIKQGA